MAELGKPRPVAQGGDTVAREVRAAELRYRALLDASRDGLAELRNERVVHANPALLALLGLPRASALIGRPLLDRVVPEDRTRAAEHLHQAAVATVALLPAVALRLRTDGGAAIWVEWWARPMDHAGAPTVLVGIRDGGERLRLQRALEQAEGLASLGALAAGVAHDAANPLSYALLGLEWLAEEFAEPQPDLAGCRDRVREVLNGVQRVTEVISELQSYAETDRQDPTRVLIPHALETALSLALHRLRHQTQLDWERGRPDLATLAPEGALVRLLVDLLVQSARVFERPDPKHNRLIVRTGHGREGPWVETESQAHLRALTPALPGLLLHGVRNLGATLTTTSTPSGHHRLRLCLPPPPTPTPLPEPSPAAIPARLQVLLVDDEPLICRALALSLERSCDVKTFTSGQEALDHLATDVVYDVVLLDIMMDPPAGPELWAWLSANRPAWRDRVVFITGGAATETARQLLRGTDAHVVTKPIDLAQLRKLVRKTGARARGS